MCRFESGGNLDDILGCADGLVQVDAHEAAAPPNENAYGMVLPLGFPACERRYQHSPPQGARISAFGDGPLLANVF
jgi:hypothetical protein